MGGSGGNQTQTTQTSLPPELSSWANKYLNTLGNLILPGGNIAASPYPNQQIAPLTPQQTQGMNLASSETYGPQGAPQGQGIDTSQLMQSVMASPYWYHLLSTQPWQAAQFSPAALNQLPGVYT